ncbi:MAG TPA: glycosyltransferase family 2 protein [Candidatus Eisenbacteria bacterium]|nr:glycosyltransferase family 2 protein [Candidatus Eisenbacteria bacterium]
MKKLTITIGIPAFNEEGNLGNLLRDLSVQKTDSFIIKEIIVASDASTDNTDNIAKQSQKVILLRGEERKGVAEMQNKIFAHATGDVLILINADTRIFDPLFIKKLSYFLKSSQSDLCSVWMRELPATNILSNLLFFSMKLKTKIFEQFQNSKNVYACHGQVRAFSKRLYKTTHFPSSIGEDAFSYFFCISKGFTFKYTNSCEAFYQLPTTLGDHQKQSIRFHNSQKLLQKYFDSTMLKKEYTIPKSLLIKECIKSLFLQPVSLFGYIGIAFYIKFFSLFSFSTSETWDIAKSSKIINI